MILSRLGNGAPKRIPFTFGGARNLHTEQKINVNGIEINTVQAGDGEKTVLLMPGALGSAWTDFRPQIEKLPELLPKYKIIAWDPPGYGKSIPPKRGFGLNFYHDDAKNALALMKTLKRNTFSILGWSDGGITALILAGRYSDHVEKLVIWGTGAYVNEDEVKALKAIKDVEKWSPRMREPMEKLYGAKGFAKLWAEWVDAAIAIFRERNGDYCCREVNCVQAPTFILHGRKDPMIAAEHIPYLLKHIDNCKYHEFPEGKHNIHLRYPDEFNKYVADFLNANATKHGMKMMK